MSAVRLVSIYKRPDAISILYQLLSEREKKVNISHRQMPTMAQHKKFIASKPYKSWDLVLDSDKPVGSVYLSKQNEIGLFIFNALRGKGYGKKALKLLIEKHPKEKRFLANISPLNGRSIDFFKKSGFYHIQNTYELRGRS